MQALLRVGDQQIRRYGNPYLRLVGVFAGAKEHLDMQVLLDPFEEQLHLPALAVQVGNQLRLQDEVVGEKHQPFATVVPDHHPAHRCGVIPARLVRRQHASLIAQHERVDPIHRMRVTPFELGIALGAGHKEGFGLVNHKQPGKVQIAAVHQVERPRFERQIVHDVDLDVAQGLAISQLGKCHGEELVQTRKIFDLAFSVVLGHTMTKGA